MMSLIDLLLTVVIIGLIGWAVYLRFFKKQPMSIDTDGSDPIQEVPVVVIPDPTPVIDTKNVLIVETTPANTNISAPQPIKTTTSVVTQVPQKPAGKKRNYKKRPAKK